MKTAFLTLPLFLLASLSLTPCESLGDANLPEDAHGNLRRGHQNDEDRLFSQVRDPSDFAEIGTPALGTVVVEPPSRETQTQVQGPVCTPLVSSANTLGGEMHHLLGATCNSNADCAGVANGNKEQCCTKQFCQCRNGGSIIGTCMDDVVTTLDEPRTSSSAVAAWLQCSNEQVCVPTGYMTSSCTSDSDCTGDNTCNVFCSGIEQFCYDPSSDNCTPLACDNVNVNCPAGMVCRDQFSAECGPRVCRNGDTNIPDYLACNGQTCKTDGNCASGYSCVGYWEDCGVAV